MEALEAEHVSNTVVYEFNYIPNKGRKCVIKVSFSQAQVGFVNQSHSETSQLVTTEWDIRSPSIHRWILLPGQYSHIL
jgi:hypothetical protein